MDLPLERNRAANKDGPLLIGWTITQFLGESQTIYDYVPLEVAVERDYQKVSMHRLCGIFLPPRRLPILPQSEGKQGSIAKATC
jgi:hypothetical protein